MSARLRLLAVLVVAAPLIACGPPPAGTTTAAAPRRALAGAVLREERVIIGRGTVVRAVGVARRWVYAATTDAILVYDRDRQAWLPPFTRDGGFDPSLVRRIGVDPDDDSAWLITTMGAWTLEPLTGFVTRAPAGALPARLRVGSLESVYREFPSVQSFERLLTRDDASFWSFPAIAGARAPDRSEVWLGTNGGGLLQVDPLFNRATPFKYGLATTGAGALARAADGLFVAPASRGLEPRPAVTFVSSDLEQFHWFDDASGRAFGGARGTALAARGGVLWMGTTRGLFRVPITGEGARGITVLNGLPGDVVLSLLARDEGVWVGTESGLALLLGDSAVARERVTGAIETPRAAVRALLATGDTLWVGSDAGLLLLPPHETRVVRPAAASTPPRLRSPVRALAAADSLVLVALDDGVLSYSLRDGAWHEPWPAAPWRTVGEVFALAADARTVWAGGAFGVVALNRA
ncbi:MAG: hypothetical protein H3C62_16460, partial [Gemmatimonadaceae bacterium]|nr:hypothetical protein [Gemmatimonadaceae bacterium]